MKKILSHFVPVVLAIALSVTASFAFAAGGQAIYSITETHTVTATATGFVVDLNGIASVTNPQGNISQYHVSVDWLGNGIWEQVSYSPVGNSNFFSGPWSGSHTFTAPGPITITIKLHHTQTGGQESGDASVSFNLTIPSEICLDGIDNDFDGFIDLADSDCLPYFPHITVTKTVINNSGGTKLPANFSLFVDSTPVTSGQTISVQPGTHTVSETLDPEYTQTSIGGQCASNGTITVLAGIGNNYSCTITNDDKVNLPPVFTSVPTSVSIPELALYTFNATATDPESNPITFSLVGAPAGASITSGGVFTWTPTEAQGPNLYTFKFRASDNHGNNNDATVNITVTEVNSAPVAVDDSKTTTEDAPLTISLASLLANDTDSDIPANTLSITSVSGNTNGVAVLGSDIIFTPDANFNGLAGFDYTLSDGSLTDTGHVNITVSSINDAPVLVSIVNKFVDELNNLPFGLSATDVDGDTVTYSITSGFQSGMSLGSLSGVFSWTPSEVQGPGVYGMTVEATDGHGGVDSKSFDINVAEVNVAPVAYNDLSESTHMNVSKSINLSADDSDIPANSLSYTVVSGPTNGTLTECSSYPCSLGSNNVTYVPNTDFIGSDSFVFKATDNGIPTLTSNTATIGIMVNDSAPILIDVPTNTSSDPVVINEETGYTFDANATDDGDSLTFSLGAGAPVGASIDPSTGIFTWMPTEAQGPDLYSITIIVSDGVLSSSQTFSVSVLEVNVIPVANIQSVTTPEDTAKDITLTGSDVDVPVQALTFTIASNPAQGTLSGFNSITGEVTYIPNADYNGSDSFTFTVSDGVAISAEATVSITVDSVNDAPVITLDAGGDPFTVLTGDTDAVIPGATCTDVEGGNLDVTVTPPTDPAYDANVNGTYVFHYSCTDGELTAETTRTVIVSGENTLALCSDTVDNDGNDLTDLLDPACLAFKPKLTVTKVVINDNGGVKLVSDFQLFIDGIATTSGAQVTYSAAGSHIVSETTDSNYTGVFSGDCNSSGSVTVAIGQTKSCTLTNNDNAPVIIITTGGGGGGGHPPIVSTPGQVLGATAICQVSLDEHLRKGYKNKTASVKALQAFLNSYLKINMTVDGKFGPGTEKYVKMFQGMSPNKEVILDPWNIDSPTGLVYLTTLTRMKNIMCPDLKLPVPDKSTLVAWSKNPTTPKN
jgi:hypothetical protein